MAMSGGSICRGRMASEVEAICRRYLELRSRLMPYTYTLAWQAHTSGPADDAAARF